MPIEALERVRTLWESMVATGSVADFIEANTPLWRSLDDIPPSEGVVLMDATYAEPQILLPHLLAGAYIAIEKSLSPAYFLRASRLNSRLKSVCRSYGSGPVFYHEPGPWKVRHRRSAKDRASRIRETLGSKVDLLNLEYRDILIGDIVYDTYLRRTGEPTVTDIDEEVTDYIEMAVSYCDHVAKILDENDVNSLVVSHPQYLPTGVLARMAIDRGASVYLRRGGTENLVLHRYEDTFDSFPGRPSRELFEAVWEGDRDLAVNEAEMYFEQRMSGDASGMPEGATEAYSNYTVVDKQWLNSKYSIDSEKPVVVVMSHIFTDANHIGSRLLFDDYMGWLRETLDFAADTDVANWLVKPHPHDSNFKNKGDVHKEVERATADVDEHSVWALPEETNPRSLLDFADVIITAKGTAGHEFPCFGIPAIIAGDTPYSEFGFTIDPMSRAEYFDTLRNVEEIEPLDEPAIQRAKVVAYLRFELMGSGSGLLPKYDGLAEPGAIFEVAASLASETDPSNDPLSSNITRFLQRNDRILIDYDRHDPFGPEAQPTTITEG